MWNLVYTWLAVVGLALVLVLVILLLSKPPQPSASEKARNFSSNATSVADERQNQTFRDPPQLTMKERLKRLCSCKWLTMSHSLKIVPWLDVDDDDFEFVVEKLYIHRVPRRLLGEAGGVPHSLLGEVDDKRVHDPPMPWPWQQPKQVYMQQHSLSMVPFESVDSSSTNPLDTDTLTSYYDVIPKVPARTREPTQSLVVQAQVHAPDTSSSVSSPRTREPIQLRVVQAQVHTPETSSSVSPQSESIPFITQPIADFHVQTSQIMQPLHETQHTSNDVVDNVSQETYFDIMPKTGDQSINRISKLDDSHSPLTREGALVDVFHTNVIQENKHTSPTRQGPSPITVYPITTCQGNEVMLVQSTTTYYDVVPKSKVTDSSLQFVAAVLHSEPPTLKHGDNVFAAHRTCEGDSMEVSEISNAPYDLQTRTTPQIVLPKESPQSKIVYSLFDSQQPTVTGNMPVMRKSAFATDHSNQKPSLLPKESSVYFQMIPFVTQPPKTAEEQVDIKQVDLSEFKKQENRATPISLYDVQKYEPVTSDQPTHFQTMREHVNNSQSTSNRINVEQKLHPSMALHQEIKSHKKDMPAVNQKTYVTGNKVHPLTETSSRNQQGASTKHVVTESNSSAEPVAVTSCYTMFQQESGMFREYPPCPHNSIASGFFQVSDTNFEDSIEAGQSTNIIVPEGTGLENQVSSTNHVTVMHARSMPSVCRASERSPIVAMSSGRIEPSSEAESQQVHQFLNQYSSIFTYNLKDPIPKDPETLSGRRSSSVHQVKSKETTTSLAESLSQIGATQYQPQVSTYYHPTGSTSTHKREQPTDTDHPQSYKKPRMSSGYSHNTTYSNDGQRKNVYLVDTSLASKPKTCVHFKQSEESIEVSSRMYDGNELDGDSVIEESIDGKVEKVPTLAYDKNTEENVGYSIASTIANENASSYEQLSSSSRAAGKFGTVSASVHTYSSLSSVLPVSESNVSKELTCHHLHLHSVISKSKPQVSSTIALEMSGKIKDKSSVPSVERDIPVSITDCNTDVTVAEEMTNSVIESDFSKEIACTSLDKNARIPTFEDGLSREVACLKLQEEVKMSSSVFSKELGCLNLETSNIEKSPDLENSVETSLSGHFDEMVIERLEHTTFYPQVGTNTSKNSQEIACHVLDVTDHNYGEIDTSMLNSPNASQIIKFALNNKNDNFESKHVSMDSFHVSTSKGGDMMRMSSISAPVLGQGVHNVQDSEYNLDIEPCVHDSLISILSPNELGASSSVIDTRELGINQYPKTEKSAMKDKQEPIIVAHTTTSPRASYSLETRQVEPRKSTVSFKLPSEEKEDSTPSEEGTTLLWKIVIKHKPNDSNELPKLQMIEPPQDRDEETESNSD